MVRINDEVVLYEEQGAIHLRAGSGPLDPTELSVDEAERLIAELTLLVSVIREQDERGE